jgi:hypothetical protein
MPSLASFPSMMRRDRKREGLRGCRAAWLISPGILDDALAIGRVALAFGDLELIATHFLNPLIGSDDWVGPLITGGQAIV